MSKSLTRRARVSATLALVLAAALPIGANAACRQIGDVRITGDCSHPGNNCQRHIVRQYGYYGNDARYPMMVVERYRLTLAGWRFDRVYSIRC